MHPADLALLNAGGLIPGQTGHANGCVVYVRQQCPTRRQEARVSIVEEPSIKRSDLLVGQASTDHSLPPKSTFEPDHPEHFQACPTNRTACRSTTKVDYKVWSSSGLADDSQLVRLPQVSNVQRSSGTIAWPRQLRAMHSNWPIRTRSIIVALKVKARTCS